MFDNYIIEVQPQPIGRPVQAGIVVRDGRGFRFFAAADAFNCLESKIFKNPKSAEVAALRRLLDLRSRRSSISGAAHETF